VVTGVPGDGPAAKAGVKEGDVIQRCTIEPAVMGGEVLPIQFTGEAGDSARFVDAVSFAKPGSTATLKLTREGKDLEVKVVVGEAPEERGVEMRVRRFDWPGMGEDAGQEGEGEARAWLGVQMEGVKTGVRIVRVMEDSPAAKAGLKDGDVILAVDGAPVQEPERVQELILARKAGDKIDLKVLHEDEEKLVEVTLGERPAKVRMGGFMIEGPGGQVEVRPGEGMERMQDETRELQRKIEAAQRDREREVKELKERIEQLRKEVEAAKKMIEEKR